MDKRQFDGGTYQGPLVAEWKYVENRRTLLHMHSKMCMCGALVALHAAPFFKLLCGGGGVKGILRRKPSSFLNIAHGDKIFELRLGLF